VLKVNDISNEEDLKMDWKERGLLATNLDYLWRCILFSQDKIFNQIDSTLDLKSQQLEGEFEEKLNDIKHQCEFDVKKANQETQDLKLQLKELTAKFDNARSERNRIEKIADDRNFELQAIKNDTDIVALKSYFNDLDKNMTTVLNEKKPQMEACQKLINVMRKIIPTKKPGGPKMLKFKLRRKKKNKLEEEEVVEEKGQDVIISGKKPKPPSPFDLLMEYLYDNYIELFVILGEEKDRVMLEKETVLKVLDDIPEDLIERLLVPPPKDSANMGLQTVLTMNPNRELSKNDVATAYKIAYPSQKDIKVKKEPKNLLLKSINKFLSNKKEKIQPMAEQNVFKMTQSLLDDKLTMDLESEKSNKSTKHMPNYVLDQLSMKFGLKTIAVKNLISLREGLSAVTKSYIKDNPGGTPYSLILATVMGLESDSNLSFSQEQVGLIIKSKPMWNEAQEQFKKNLQVKRGAKLSDFSLFDLQTGGTCSLLEVIDVFTIWCTKDKELLSSFLPTLLPNLPPETNKNEKATKKFYLDFSLMKICNKVAKLGKDVKFIYNALDVDGSGSLDPVEILVGLKEKFSIYFSEEEADNLCKYLDEDGSGDVDLEEFKAKVNYGNYNSNYHLYTITEQRFIELLLQEWNRYLERTKIKLMNKFVEFDDNGDGVLTFEEFEQLINNLEKSMDRSKISELFNETLEMDEKATDLDQMNPECF